MFLICTWQVCCSQPIRAAEGIHSRAAGDSAVHDGVRGRHWRLTCTCQGRAQEADPWQLHRKRSVAGQKCWSCVVNAVVCYSRFLPVANLASWGQQDPCMMWRNVFGIQLCGCLIFIWSWMFISRSYIGILAEGGIWGQKWYGFGMLLGYGSHNLQVSSSTLICSWAWFQCSWAWNLQIMGAVPNRLRREPFFLSSHTLYLTSQRTKLSDVGVLKSLNKIRSL